MYYGVLCTLKGTVSRDFLLLVFFMNQFPPKPLSIPLGPFRIFSKIRGDTVFTSHGAPPVSTTPVANFPLVSLTPVAICHRRRGHRRQICRRYQQHKGNGWQNLPPVSLIPVAILPPVSLTPVANLSCEYLREFSKKFETVLMGYSGAGGKLIHEKNQEQKIS